MNNNYQQMAADACYLLRKQLRDQEMDNHIKGMFAYKDGAYTLERFVFVTSKELKQELERRTQKLLDKAKQV